VKVTDQAQGKAGQERSKAAAQGASGLAKFKQGDRTAQRARSLSHQGDVIGASRAYLEAANLFATAGAESAKKRGGPSSRANGDDPAPDPEALTQPETPAAAPAREEPTHRRRPSEAVGSSGRPLR
jgi:hypothetical protein